MKALVLGSGGREHAIAYKLSQSSIVSDVFVAPGNAGTQALATNVNLSANDFDQVGKWSIENNIKLIVVGPEDPLVNGVVDHFRSSDDLKHIHIVGPDQQAAQLEGSKDFAKSFMQKYDIPTAAFQTFTKSNIEEGYQFLDKLSAPYVLKADGLAAGKGVLIIDSLEEAKASLKEMLLDAKFGEASSQVVIEEFLSGIELSVFVLTDGESYHILPEAKDYKRIGEGDTGLNTGGMGAVSPVPFAQGEFLQKVEDRIVKPTIAGFKEEGMDYRGFVFIGLMNVNGDPYVIEYNVRMGDPETEAVLPRIESDFGEMMLATAQKNLDSISVSISSQFATTIVLVSGGYPEAYEKGKVISGLGEVNDSLVFHAGTKQQGDDVVTSGGRVLAITSMDDTKQGALDKSFAIADSISFDKKYFRRDIGSDV
jgi:phosphoribosylamine--glycine ligase